MKLIFSISIVIIVFSLVACQVDKYPVESLPQSQATTGVIAETTYVQQKPDWDWQGFNMPQAIIVGNEPFIYVADTYNDRIVMLDIAGRVIGYSQFIKRPIALAEDERLQLLVCASFDTLLAGHSAPTTFGALYRLNLPAVNHAISMATPRRVFFEPADSTRRYTGVATLYNNMYYVARTGPKNDLTLIDRDDAIILFSKNDVLVTPVTTGFSPDGTGLLSIHYTTSLATLSPTTKAVDFIFGQVEVPGGVVPLLKVQWIQLTIQGQTEGYASKYPSIDPTIGITQINKFMQPRGIVVDQSGNLFVVDSGTDSLYRFNTRGLEQYSFGGHHDKYGRNLVEPYGIAYYNYTIYIADRGSNRVCRFKLSTDME
jgi:hypothetical protein